MSLDLKSWKLSDLSFVDVQEYLKHKDIILIPIASCEQHGRHLPLATDMITAEEISARAGRKAKVLYTPLLWTGYSPQHVGSPGEGLGTITLRSNTLLNLYYDVCRSLIHHGFNKLMFVNGHGSNMKVIEPLLRKVKYETGAWVGCYKPYAENYIGLIKGLMENPPEETPGWHASELETSQVMAYNPELVRMDRAIVEKTHVPQMLPDSFMKKDGMPDVEFKGYKYFVFPMDHREFSPTGCIGNPMRATKEKGEKAFELYANHLVEALAEFEKVKVTVKDREFRERSL
jgi:creatinine amidohydrolase